jgi:hypothetical protein
VHNLDYWTSATQKDCPGKLSWCSLERPVRSRNLSWAATEDGDCVSVKYGPKATSTFTKTSCDKKLPFICEVKFSHICVSSIKKEFQVHNKGTFAAALQTECMEVWGISVGTICNIVLLRSLQFSLLKLVDMLLFDQKNYNVSTMPKNLKVCTIF